MESIIFVSIFLFSGFIINQILGLNNHTTKKYFYKMKKIWLFIYFIVAFGFSLTYYNYKNHFYVDPDHINKYENSKKEEFKTEFKKYVLTRLHKEEPNLKDKIQLRSIYFDKFNIDKRSINFILKLELFNKNKFMADNETFDYDNYFKFNIYKVDITQLGNGYYGFILKTQEEFKIKKLENVLFGNEKNKIADMNFDKENSNIIVRKIFLKDASGFKEQDVFSGNILTGTLSLMLDELINKNVFTYFNMLYFSIVTITTLGYGDILPLTVLGKTLIALEVIIEVLILGLFLNSLSIQRKE